MSADQRTDQRTDQRRKDNTCQTSRTDHCHQRDEATRLNVPSSGSRMSNGVAFCHHAAIIHASFMRHSCVIIAAGAPNRRALAMASLASEYTVGVKFLTRQSARSSGILAIMATTCSGRRHASAVQGGHLRRTARMSVVPTDSQRPIAGISAGISSAAARQMSLVRALQDP
jgi:hypothetical protein